MSKVHNKFTAIHTKASLQNQTLLGDVEFKSGVIPDNFVVSKGKLSISNRHYIVEQSSLRWDYEQGDVLSYSYKVCDIPVPTEQHHEVHNNYTNSICDKPWGLAMYIYSEEYRETTFRVQFYKDNLLQCEFDFVPCYVGWREIKVLYNANMMRGKKVTEFDRMDIVAHNNSGSLYFDNINMFVQIDVRSVGIKEYLPLNRQCPTRRLTGWINKDYDYFNIPYKPLRDKKYEYDFSLIQDKYLDYSVKTDKGTLRNYNELLACYESFNIKEVDGCITGQRLNTPKSGEINKLLGDMGRLYLTCKGTDKGQKLEKLACLMIRHIMDQDFNLAWYNGRGFATGVLVFKEVLKKKKLLTKAIEFMKQGYKFNRIYDLTTFEGWHSTKGEDTDTIGTCLPSHIALILCIDDPYEKVRDMEYFIEYLENRVLQFGTGLRDGYLPDGTSVHHGSFLVGYQMTANNSLAKIIHILSGTIFQISSRGYNFFKKIILTELSWRIGKYHPLNLAHIRMSDNTVLFTDYVGEAALASSQGIDHELAAMYLRICEYDESSKSTELYQKVIEKLGQCDVKNEVSLNKVLSYSAQAIHRRKDWGVYVKAHSRYVFGMETWYSEVCAFPYFKTLGALEICNLGQQGDVKVNNSWDLDNGFDWRRFPGTTVARIPYNHLKVETYNIGGEPSEVLMNDQTFVGGVSDGLNGLFAMHLHGHPKYDLDDLYGKKTYFFYEDMILCMGSNIEKFTEDYNVETILFQNSCTPRQLELHNHWLIDSRGNGYYIPEDNKLVLKCQVQENPNRGDTAVGKGTYELAYFDHGLAPRDAEYEYIIKLDTDGKAMDSFSKQMVSSQAPVQILQRDSQAHIAKFSDTVMYSIFNKNHELDQGYLLGVNTGCNLMITEKAEELDVIIADPDLRFYEGTNEDMDPFSNLVEISTYKRMWRGHSSQSSHIQIVLKGKLEVVNSHSCSVKYQTEDYTVIETTCKDGLSNRIQLRKIGKCE